MTKLPSQSQVVEVAKEYARLIRARLTDQELDDVVWGNNDEDDFMDSNMVMDAAIKKYYKNFASSSLNNSFFNTLWNDAWSLAKLNDLYV